MTILNNSQNSCSDTSQARRFPAEVHSAECLPRSDALPYFSDHRVRSAALVAADLMTPAEVAKVLSISVRTLAAWRSVRRSSLPWVRVGNQVRYRKADIAAWLESQLQNNAHQLAGGA